MRHVELIKNVERDFAVTPDQIKKVIRDFHSEMREGLSGQKSSLKMIPTYVERPKGAEKGTFIALDLGGTNFRVLALELKGNRTSEILFSKKAVLRKDVITASGRKLFDFMAHSVKKIIKIHATEPDKTRNIGFTFSFPIKQTGINSGTLIGWTKGFTAGGVRGKDVVRLMNSAFRRAGLPNAKIVAITNDTVSTLVSKSYEDPACDVGVILGTGTNACYCEKVKNITKSRFANFTAGEMLINIEWGNFNKLRLTPYDRLIDKFSKNPGKQLLEKMVSGMYLGEIVRVVLKEMSERGAIFRKTDKTALNKKDGFKTEYISAIENDSTKELYHVNDILKTIGVSKSLYSDRKAVRRICRAVSKRAARLGAAAIAAVVTKIDPRLLKPHTVAIDGSLYEKHAGFSRDIRHALCEVFPTAVRKSGIKISLTKDGSGKGAAVIAAIVKNARDRVARD
ncbi:MAG: hexokinase [Candidatus Omnitrophica bacterium]|nr:hexokinase [Candidatus Omnitrophota bacterium]